MFHPGLAVTVDWVLKIRYVSICVGLWHNYIRFAVVFRRLKWYLESMRRWHKRSDEEWYTVDCTEPWQKCSQLLVFALKSLFLLNGAAVLSHCDFSRWISDSVNSAPYLPQCFVVFRVSYWRNELTLLFKKWKVWSVLYQSVQDCTEDWYLFRNVYSFKLLYVLCCQTNRIDCRVVFRVSNPFQKSFKLQLNVLLYFFLLLFFLHFFEIFVIYLPTFIPFFFLFLF